MAMSFALASLVHPSVSISEPDVVTKSYPVFGMISVASASPSLNLSNIHSTIYHHAHICHIDPFRRIGFFASSLPMWRRHPAPTGGSS